MNINFSSISEIIFELELSWQKNYQLYIAIALSDFRYSIYTNTLKIIKDSFFAKAPLNDITYINDIAKRHQVLMVLSTPKEYVFSDCTDHLFGMYPKI